MVLPKLLAFLPMKPTVYIETSVVSYLTARPSRDLIVAGHQQVTADWWAEVLPSVAAFVSELVLEEAAKGDENAAAQRLARIEVFPVLEAVGEVDGLAREYASALQLPDKALADAYHMALATWHGMDYVVSWNCTHIASGRVQKVLLGVNNGMGFQTPILCTPEELMEV
jgi:predicted nucleic acid-binding protein